VDRGTKNGTQIKNKGHLQRKKGTSLRSSASKRYCRPRSASSSGPSKRISFASVSYTARIATAGSVRLRTRPREAGLVQPRNPTASLKDFFFLDPPEQEGRRQGPLATTRGGLRWFSSGGSSRFGHAREL
jgi:hypothetical protein